MDCPTTETSKTARRVGAGGVMRKTPSFKLNRCTVENYACSDVDAAAFFGPYAHIRRDRMDYSYHSNYTQDRQMFQDCIISDMLTRATVREAVEEGTDESESTTDVTEICTTPTAPWCVFTAGVMGAGKRYTIHSLVRKDRFPLLSCVYVDPNEICQNFPEFAVYAQRASDRVYQFTGREAGYIAEILIWAALEAGKNVVVGGILRDTEWYATYFGRLREQFPKLRIAILHVVSPREAVLRRIEKRTHRTLSEGDLEVAMEGVSRSALMLAPLVDYFGELRNDPGANDVELLTDGGDWTLFRSHWVQTCDWVPNTLRRSPTAVKNGPSVDETSEEMRTAVNATLEAVNLRRSATADFTLIRSTEENYRSSNMNFYGPYADLRAKLDYKYHSNYTEERQLLQDSIIANMVQDVKLEDINGDVCTTPTEPWIVFTAGAFGSGKSHTIRDLVQKGRFPLQGFVAVDPDEIRRHLPEFLLYASLVPEKAGELTNKECGYVAEILTLVGLEKGVNVLVDGSLRDYKWYQVYFSQLRRDYPKLRIAILHVTAPREAVFKRTADRALTTGRVIPKETLEMALEQVPRSVSILAPLTDYWCELNNSPDADDVQLVKAKDGQDWDDFRSNWLQLCAWIPGNGLRSSKYSSRHLIKTSLRT